MVSGGDLVSAADRIAFLEAELLDEQGELNRARMGLAKIATGGTGWMQKVAANTLKDSGYGCDHHLR